MSRGKSIKEKIDSIPQEQTSEMEAKLHAKDGVIKSLKSDVSRLLKRNEQLENAIDMIAAIGDQERVAQSPIRKTAGPMSKSYVIPIIVWSDWHVAELVSASKTNGKNKFSPEIAKTRAANNTLNTLRLIDLCRRNSTISEAILVLGGDFVTGYLHEELAQTNCMAPIEECYFAQKLLADNVAEFASHAKLKKLRIICHRGNHGRTTRRIQFKNDYESSYETWIYWNLRDQLRDAAEWYIPESDIAYTKMLPGHTLRSFHGHQIKYGGGIGGIAVPLNRWLNRQDQTTMAVFSVLGHFHMHTPSARFSINGSIKGWDEFAQSKGFPFEHPCQTMQLFDCKRRQMTARYPIFCE